MNTGEERVLSELQSALDALAKASEHLEKASQESTASGASQKVAGAKGFQQAFESVAGELRGFHRQSPCSTYAAQ